ncbi:MAG TPA: hypothetical protein VE891_00815 [Allosphingosinicella sp.]|nr:hypothetical protein [Allosphingosinicella sp.]
MSNPAIPAPWIAEFCNDYTPLLFSVGKWTLIAGVILGIALALAAIVAQLRKDAAGGAGNFAPASPATVLDAIKGFILALSSAPTWLALFGGGILLLWLAGNSVPDICEPPTRQAPQTQTAPQAQGQGGATPVPADRPRR